MSTLTIRLDDSMQKELDQESRALHLSRSQLVREALKDYLKRREDRKFMAALVRAANATDPVENKLYSQEGLAWGDRALSVADGPPALTKRPSRRRRS
jgi:predicted transcriptional regulator